MWSQPDWRTKSRGFESQPFFSFLSLDLGRMKTTEALYIRSRQAITLICFRRCQDSVVLYDDVSLDDFRCAFRKFLKENALNKNFKMR